jgi:catechol 2,3-dioxygenase-like lactoylglutathione lyase family enzyme
MDHVGVVVADLAAATEFFVELGLVLQGEGPVEGRWVDRVVGLEGVRADIAMMQTPDGNARLELTKFHSPSSQGDKRQAPANTPGLRHVAFAVEDIDAVVARLRVRGAELRKSPALRRFAEPSDGLEPSTPPYHERVKWPHSSLPGSVAEN